MRDKRSGFGQGVDVDQVEAGLAVGEAVGDDVGHEVGGEVGDGAVAGVPDLAEVLQRTVSTRDRRRRTAFSTSVRGTGFMFFFRGVTSSTPCSASALDRSLEM